MFTRTAQVISILAIFLSAFYLAPASAKPRLVQTIKYDGGGAIRHYREDGVVKYGVTRICLRNKTGSPKAIDYKVNATNPLKATPGREVCANFPSRMRLNFSFVDRGIVERKDTMRLGAYKGDKVIFEWISDRGIRAGVDCGRNNQRPCKIWERVPSCNKGLVENFAKGLCVAKARPGVDCGRENQRACKLWERVPSCNKGLVEVLGKGVCVDPKKAGLICGGENQRPCTLTERIPSCNSGLVENFIHNKCVATADTPRYRRAEAKFKELGGFIASKIGFAQHIASDPQVRGALKDNRQALDGVVNRSAAGSRQMPDGYLLRTLTVGAAAGAKVIVGGEAGAGAAIDLTGHRPAYLYGTANWSKGIGVGGSGGVDVGFWVCQNNKIGGDNWGVEFSPVEIARVAETFADLKKAFKPGADVGIGMWFGYDGVFQGFTITPNIGVGVDFGGLIKAGTVVQDDPTVNCDGTPVRGASRTSTAAKPGKQVVQTIAAGSSRIRHLVSRGAAKPGTMRLCLENSTSTLKMITHRVAGVNPLKAAPNGGESCASLPANFRFKFNWVDNGRVVKSDAMNLSAYEGDTVYFDWLR